MARVRIELGQLFNSLGWEASQLSRCLAWGVMVPWAGSLRHFLGFPLFGSSRAVCYVFDSFWLAVLP